MTFSERFLSTHGVIEVGGRHVKRYHLSAHDHGIEPAIQAAAEAFLPRLLPASADSTPPATFMILHRGLEAAYLVVYSWVWDNVIECHSATAGVPFLGSVAGDLTQFVVLDRPWIGCVWELAPFEHERSAWVRHMLEAEPPDLAAYLADTLPAGPAGGSRPRRAK
jgi:hypothetical protein